MSTQTDFAAALLEPQSPGPPGLRTWNGSDASTRFAVYRNNVVASLIGVLADTFPVVAELVGIDFFRAMAVVFVRTWPPRSPLMAEFGTDFPQFIDSFEPAAGVPYLADVARLEMARVEALHAADAPPLALSTATQALAAGDRTTDLRLLAHPSVRLVPSRFPVFSIWAAHQGEGDLEAVDLSQPEAALVLRPNLDVLVVALPPEATAFVACVLQGRPFGECAAQATAAAPAFDLAATLGLLLRNGVLTSIGAPPGDSP